MRTLAFYSYVGISFLFSSIALPTMASGGGRLELPNPPQVLANGKIANIDGDLVQITLGTDQGVYKNHTLDVYRIKPQPAYLGQIRIVDANSRSSVGRRLDLPGAGKPPIQIGDLVTSKFDAQEKKAPTDQQAKNADLDRLRKENEVLQAKLLQAELERKELTARTVTLEAQLKAIQARNEELLQQLREATRKAIPGAIPKNDKPNPPPTLIRGVIEKVDSSDRTIVMLSIGADAGLAKGHTLEAYRLKPRAKYLGMIRIIEVTPQKAVARVVRVGAAETPTLQAGDQVTASLKPDESRKK